MNDLLGPVLKLTWYYHSSEAITVPQLHVSLQCWLGAWAIRKLLAQLFPSTDKQGRGPLPSRVLSI